MNDQSDADFTSRALARLPASASSPGFEAALLAGYEDWRGCRSAGFPAAIKAAVRGFANLVWPGAPVWAPASAFAVAAAALEYLVWARCCRKWASARGRSRWNRRQDSTLLSADGGEDL